MEKDSTEPDEEPQQLISSDYLEGNFIVTRECDFIM